MRMIVAAILISAFAAPAQALPPLLEQAIAAAETAAANAPRFAFTRSVDADGDVNVAARFDPNGPEGGRWTLMRPVDAELKKAEREVFDGIVEDDEADIDAMVEEPRELIGGDVRLVREDDTLAVFETDAPDDDEGDEDYAKFKQALKAEIAVDKLCGCLVSFRLYNIASFKPAAVAKVKEFDMTISFAEAWDGGPLITRRVDQKISGSALFQKFDQTVVIELSDVAPVE